MIFTFWVNDASNSNPHIEEPASVAVWREQYPTTIYSDQDVIPILQEFGADYVDLYKRIRIPACKSDVARLLLLYRFGGLYFDSHTGPGKASGLVSMFEKLATYDIILFDKMWQHRGDGDIHLMNTVLFARRLSPILNQLIHSALNNLRAQEQKEHDAKTYVPYNIFVLTGAWDMRIVLFEKINGVMSVKSEYREQVCHFHLKEGEDCGFHIYKYYSYRKEGRHWSERQNTELLFLPRDA